MIFLFLLCFLFFAYNNYALVMLHVLLPFLCKLYCLLAALTPDRKILSKNTKRKSNEDPSSLLHFVTTLM